MKRFLACATLALTAALAACSGGGGGSASPFPTPAVGAPQAVTLNVTHNGSPSATALTVTLYGFPPPGNNGTNTPSSTLSGVSSNASGVATFNVPQYQWFCVQAQGAATSYCPQNGVAAPGTYAYSY